MNAKLLGYDGFVFDEMREADAGGLAIAPAQRVDLMLNGDDESKVAMNDIREFALQELSGQEALSIAKFKFSKPGEIRPNTPIVLKPNKMEEPKLDHAKRVPFIMSGGAMGQLQNITYKDKVLSREDLRETKQVWAFNGVANLADAPLFRIERGQTVIIEAENLTGWLHGIHLHGHHFQVLSKNGANLKVRDWRDTFLIDRDEKIEIAFVASNPGKWLLHCHMLEHAAAGMRTWFEVV